MGPIHAKPWANKYPKIMANSPPVATSKSAKNLPSLIYKKSKNETPNMIKTYMKGKIILNDSNVLDFLNAGCLLDLNKLKKDSEEYVYRHIAINEENWKVLLNYSSKYQLERIQNKVMHFVLRNKNSFWKERRDDILSLNLDTLKISRHKFNKIYQLFPNLTQLSLNSTDIKEDYLVSLVALKNLKTLSLKRCPYIKPGCEKIVAGQPRNHPVEIHLSEFS